jgi:hypothetical protein
MTAGRLRHLSLALASSLAVALTGCGEEEQPAPLLSQSRADTLLDLLEDAEQQFEDGDCDTLEGQTLPALEEEVTGVSNEIEESFRAALQEETQALAELASNCEPAEEPAPAPAPEETVAPTTEVAPPPTTTETVPPTTTEEETTEEVEPEEDDQGNDDSSGSGSGSGGLITPPGDDGEGDG